MNKLIAELKACVLYILNSIKCIESSAKNIKHFAKAEYLDVTQIEKLADQILDSASWVRKFINE